MKEKLIEYLQVLYWKAIGVVKHLKRTIRCKAVWYGNDYGGFYVNPDLITENAIVYSFGIGWDTSFDNKMIASHQCKVFGFDPTPTSIDWVKKQSLSKKFHFTPVGIGTETAKVDFFLPIQEHHISGSATHQSNVSTHDKVEVQMKSLKDIMQELGHTRIDVLKMDIEGSEYEVLENILLNEIPIDQFLVEFHDRFFEDGRDKSRKVVELMEQYGYGIFATSNCLEEVSFIKKELV